MQTIPQELLAGQISELFKNILGVAGGFVDEKLWSPATISQHLKIGQIIVENEIKTIAKLDVEYEYDFFLSCIQ